MANEHLLMLSLEIPLPVISLKTQLLPLLSSSLGPGPENKNKIAENNDDELIYHVDRFIEVQRLCIPLKVATEVIAIAHGDGHPNSSRFYEIIGRC